jgi:hypothetical protein
MLHELSIVPLAVDFPTIDHEPGLAIARKIPVPQKISRGHGILNDKIQKSSGMPFEKSMVNPRYPVLSAGIEINKEFPIGSQQAPPYNVNARGNLLSDYIPAAYFRLHLDPRFYLETAIQINSPQYCESVALISHTDSLTYIPGRYNTTTTTLTLKKLYYTDVPVSLHYRLGNNLYIGTGIQFSFLQGGAVLQEVRYNGYGTVPDSVIQEAVSLKENPSAYHYINKVDLRVLLDMNYHWHRFALGVRYQKGLSEFLKNSQAGSTPAGKNAALGIYLQWDIWKQK